MKKIMDFSNKYFNIFSTFKTVSDLEGFYTFTGNSKIYQAEQVHGKDVTFVNSNKYYYENVDGLIACDDKTPVMIRTADCAPIFFYDEISGVYGAYHAGRAGTEKGISLEIVDKLRQKYNLLNNIRFIIGPCICFNCYQIDREKNLYYDIVQKNIDQLIKSGICQRNIAKSDICTLEDSRFYSYRETGTEKRIYNVIYPKDIQLT